MKTSSLSIRTTAAQSKSAIAMLMVAGGLAAALPAQANPDPASVAAQAATKEIVPCVKTKTHGLAPCVKTKGTPGSIIPCIKNKTGAIAPCVKTKVATEPSGH